MVHLVGHFVIFPFNLSFLHCVLVLVFPGLVAGVLLLHDRASGIKTT